MARDADAAIPNQIGAPSTSLKISYLGVMFTSHRRAGRQNLHLGGVEFSSVSYVPQYEGVLPAETIRVHAYERSASSSNTARAFAKL